MTARPLDTTRPTSTPPSPLRGEPLLDVSRLTVEYVTERGEVPACNEVSFTLRRGEILGLAGESGSGKSSLITALARLQRPPALTTGGEIRYHTRDGHVLDLVTLDERRMRALRWTDLAIVLQSAMAALNPVMRLQAQFADVMAEHQPGITRDEVAERTGRLLRMVGIAPERKRSYPHELSGGMRQRALIALALACEPELVLMDEPTTAVDVVMQRQIMGQILRLQRRLGFAVVFVTHDLSLLMEIADRIAIMYARPDRGGRRARPALRRSAAPVYPRPARRLPAPARTAHTPHRHPGKPARPARPPARLCLPPPLQWRLPECAQVVPRLHQVPSLGGERQAACLLHDTTDPEGAR